MSATAADSAVRQSFRLSFYFWITATMAGFIFGGFGLTYWQPMATGTLDPLPPIVHLHGFFFFLWIVLLVTQSLLINVRQVRLHRSLGTFGIAIGTGVLITGTLLTLMFGENDSPTTVNYYDLMYLGLTAVVAFGLLFTLAIRQTRVPENHRRLILFATIPLLPPGINRLYMVAMGMTELPLVATYVTMDAIVAAILIHDWRQLGKIAPASLVGAAVILLPQLLHAPITTSGAFAGICDWLTSLVYYR